MARGAIGHLDADTFYVSAERVRFPRLAGRPAAVLGNQGACVIAKSGEMKAAGVKTGEPIWEAKAKCPEGVYLKRDFRWYEVLSQRMLDTMRGRYPVVEYYSVDEFFFMVPECDYQAEAERARELIWREVGVPVTVGIARSRTLAKLVSDLAKPFGARAVMDQAEEDRLLEGIPVTEITGIAGRRAKRLAPWGIRTCLDFRRADRRLMRGLLTCSGESLWWEINGEPVQPILARRKAHKVISRGGSFGESTDDPRVLYGWLIRNLERLVEELRYHEVRTGRVTVWVAYRSGRAGQGRANLPAPTDRFDTLLESLGPCLRRAWLSGQTATRMHLFAEQLTPRRDRQLGLFDSDFAAKTGMVPAPGEDRISRLKHLINDRHGRFALRSAATLYLEEPYADPTQSFDICDIHGKSCF
jgi:DNA polymerase V